MANKLVRVLRDNIVIHEGKLDSLRRFKDEASEVKSGTECGIGITNYTDAKVGDVIEVYEREEIARKLESWRINTHLRGLTGSQILYFREISNLVQTQVKDPRLENTVITKVEMSDNMKIAKIFYRNLISSSDQAELEKGFKKASGFLRSSLARNLSLKRVPSLIFIFDELNIYD